MQKRIKLSTLLKDIHPAYPQLWSQLLLSINEQMPSFHLLHLGKIIYQQGQLYLYLNQKYTKGFLNVTKQEKLKQPIKNSSIQPIPREMTKAAKTMLWWIVTFLEKLILSSPEGRPLTIVNLGLLGKLVLSKNSMEYINGQHNWKYNHIVNRIKLPKLLDNQYSQSDAGKITRAISLSLHKTNSQKKQETKKLMRKSISFKQLPNYDKIRTKTENSKEIRQSLLPQKSQKLLMLKQKREQLNLHYKTEISESKIKSISRSRMRLSQSRSKSKQKLSDSFNKKIVQNKSSSKQSNSSKIRSNIPQQRQKLKINNDYKEKEVQSISSFINRRNLSLVIHSIISVQNFNSYEQQIVQIFAEKRKYFVNKRSQKYLKEIRKQQELKITKKFSCKGIKLLTSQDNQKFARIYSIFQCHKRRIKSFSYDYIIDVDIQNSLVSKFINQLSSYLQKHTISIKISIQIALILQQYHEEYLKMQEKLVEKISFQVKVIILKINQFESFEKLSVQFLDKYISVFIQIEQFIKQFCPKQLFLQSWQKQYVLRLKDKLQSLLQHCKTAYDKNLMYLECQQVQNVFTISYSNDKEALQSINSLEELRKSILEEINFKSEVRTEGIILQMKPIKKEFLKRIDNTLNEIYKFYREQQLNHRTHLASQLRQVINIKLDYLSAFCTQQYKDNIKKNYSLMKDCILFILSNLCRLLSESAANHYLNDLIILQTEMNNHFTSFDYKLNEYKQHINKTSKLIQSENKKNKLILVQLTKKMRILVQGIHNQKSIMDNRLMVQQLNYEYQKYLKKDRQLIQLMKQNEMIHWEDDTFFSGNITHLKWAIAFLQSNQHKILFSISARQVSIQQFHSAFSHYSKFIELIEQSRFEKIFKSSYILLEKSLILIEVFLYQNYSDKDIQNFLEAQIDIEQQRNNKIYTLAKKYQGLHINKMKKIISMYHESKINEYNNKYEFNPEFISLYKIQGQFDILFIANIEDIRKQIILKKQQSWKKLLSLLQTLAALHQDLIKVLKMIYLISLSSLSLTSKNNIKLELKAAYEFILTPFVTEDQIELFEEKLALVKNEYIHTFYNQKANIFSRYYLYPFDDIIQLNDWSSSSKIIKNSKILFSQIEQVQVKGTTIYSITIGKDVIKFQNPLTIVAGDFEVSKQVYLYINDALRNCLKGSVITPLQLKLMNWFIFFTQQFQLSLLSKDHPDIKKTLNKTVSYLSNGLRYDQNLHHKSVEITQLKLFIDQLSKFQKVKQASDYEWVSTIRCYDKFKNIKIHQFDRIYDYQFEPKIPQIVDSSFYINTTFSFGCGQSRQYRISSYILGQPFITIEKIDDYGFREEYSAFLNIIKKFGYFVKFSAHKDNYRSTNFLHKKLLDLTLPRDKSKYGAQIPRLPIYIQYENHLQFPLAFPERIRCSQNFDINVGIDYIFLMKVNRYQKQLQNHNISINHLVKIISLVNILHQLSLQDIEKFVEKLGYQIQNNRQSLSKFCFKYFVDTFKIVISQQLNQMLDSIMYKCAKNTLHKQQDILSEQFRQFIESEKCVWLIYGPISHKTFTITKILQKNINNKVQYIEGLKSYKQWKNPNKIKCIVEARYIWNMEPSLLGSCSLTSLEQLTQEDCLIIFNHKLQKLKVIGNYKILWEIFRFFQQISVEIGNHKSLLSMIELVLNILGKHVMEHLNQLQPSDQQTFEVNINKNFIGVFILLLHEIYFYMMCPESRKKLQQRLKVPLITSNIEEDMATLTCKGLSCIKIMSIIKREKNQYMKLVAYQKEILIIKRYLALGQIVTLQADKNVSYHIIKQCIKQSHPENINITLTPPYFHLLKYPKLNNLLYIVEDVHLATRQNLTQFKSFLPDLLAESKIKIFILTKSFPTQELKQQMTLKIPQIQTEQIFKYQSKQGILESFQTRSKKLWNNQYFKSKDDYYFFLIKTTMRLPSQYYQKFYARQLINIKFRADLSAVDIISKEENYIRQVVGVTSERTYLYQHKGQQLEHNDLEINKKVEKVMLNKPFLEQQIYRSTLKQILPYCLANKIYVIQQDIKLLPEIISTITDRKIYQIKDIKFMPKMIYILQEIKKSEEEFILEVQQPLVSSQKWRQFMELYLEQMDIISYYPQLYEHWIQLSIKEQYIFRKTQNQLAIKMNLLQIIYQKIKIILCCSHKPKLYPQHPKLLHFNCRIQAPQKKSFAVSLLHRISHNHTLFIQNILTQYHSLLFSVVQADLIHISHFQTLLNNLIKRITLESQKITNKNQELQMSKFILYKLNKIKTSFLDKVSVLNQQIEKSNIVLEEIRSRISAHQRYQIPREMQLHHFRDLSSLRSKFFNLKENHITITSTLQQQFFNQIKQAIFKDHLTIHKSYIIMSLDTQLLQDLIQDREAAKTAIMIYQRYTNQQLEQLETFLPFQYFKYMLNIIEEYQKIQYTKQFLQKQTSEANYFYLLDISIQLKKNHQQIASNLDVLQNKLKIFDGFIGALESIQKINIDEGIMRKYSLHKTIKYVLRNYCIEVNKFPLLRLLQPFAQSYALTKRELAEDILIDEQSEFEQFNLKIFKEQRKILVYDPYFRVQHICKIIERPIVYIKSIHQLEEIKHTIETVICISVDTLEVVLQSKTLIQNCIEFMDNFNKDNSNNKQIKLVISVRQQKILQTLSYQFPLLNLDISLIKFGNLIKRSALNKQEKYQRLKQNYLNCRQKINKKLELVKTLNEEQMEQYLVNLQQMITNYRLVQQDMNSTIEVINKDFNQQAFIETLFKLIKQKEDKIPLSVTLGKLNYIELGLSLQDDISKKYFLRTLVKPFTQLQQIIQCIENSRFLLIIYEEFNKQKIREIFRLEHNKNYNIRIVIDISDQVIEQFMEQSSQLYHTPDPNRPEIVIFFLKESELSRLGRLLKKCSVAYL